MMKLQSYLLPVFLGMALFTAIVNSCNKKDNNINSGKTALYSFGPTGAKPGDTLRFIGVNLNKVTSIRFSGINAVVDQKNFVQQSGELILLIVPSAAEKGYVTLKTPDGDIVTKTVLNLGITISVSSITKQARPGDNITITGNYLNWVDGVTFNKNKLVQTFVSKSITQLVVTVPADAQTGPLVLHFGGTDSAYLQTADTLKVSLPLAASFSPNPVKHQANDTITGTDLDLVKKIWFTGVSTPVTSFIGQSATQLVVKIPSSTQSGKVTLEAASGVQTVSSTSLNVLLPAITPGTGMSPNPVSPGSNLTITGTNLDLVTSITFQNAPAVKTFVSQTPAQIVVTVPNGVLRGKLTLGVLNSTLTVLSPDILEISGSIPPPAVALPIYSDRITSNWNGWVGAGWGGTKNLTNPSPVRDGIYSCAINYVGGWGSPLQLGGANISLAAYTTFKISIYGAPGSGGKKINIGLNAADSYTVTVVEGMWTDYAIPLSSMTAATTLTDIWIKEYSGVGGFTIYINDMGLN